LRDMCAVWAGNEFGLRQFYGAWAARTISLQIGGLERPPSPVADMQHFNCLSFFLNAVDHSLDRMRPTTIKNVP